MILARQIAHGAAVHFMPIRDYQKSPPWETNYYLRLADFLLTQKLAGQILPARAVVALFQPTWSFSALRPRSAANPFVPLPEEQARFAKIIGLVESFGVPYRLITERDLLEPGRLRKYRHIIVPLWDLMPDILDAPAYARLADDPRIIPIPTGTNRVTRSEFRELLTTHQVPISLDFDSDLVLAGRVNNLIFNWSGQPLSVKTGNPAQPTILEPNEFRLVR